ncbi:DHA2 family efflux MFS transporter permease subunit [Brevibacillus sp. SYP-B805]|uniref:DHA2 family efflux MFS transporter permease subunit n=1 Tax=Brevibacillus sp. SYP-B805 TaxID=1578199 RepID=UPI0013EC2A97|nr:DHA2 family efflux MFS transporter permease subunit [Brevibacillus sp. SYP-B805]NGQ94788.1 DHA2 family efflux MFS transporter permease subunit [Brevibacillus sp. SYP-B805]
MASSEEKKIPGVFTTTMIIVIGTFMAILDTSILNVALPKLMVLFSVDTKQIEWVLTAYMLVSGAIIPITTYLGERFGYTRLYVISVASFTVGSLLCGLAWDNPSLIVFRVIQGIGGGLIMPVGQALMFRFIPREKMGVAMGLFGLSIAAAPSIGPTLGGLIVEEYSWRWLFMINVPVGIIGVLLAHFLLPDTPRKKMNGFDYWGFILSSGSAFLFLLALAEGQDWGWTSYEIIMLLFTATMMLLILIVIELNHPEPLMDIRLFRNKEFSFSILFGSGLYIAMITGVVLIPIYLQSIRGYSAIQTGLIMMPQALAMGAMMPIAGRLYDKIGARPLAMVGIPLIIYSTYMMHTLSVDTPADQISWYMVIRGMGMGLTFMPINAAGVSTISPLKMGAASSMSTLIRSVAGAIGIALTTVVMNNRQFLHQHRLSEDLDLFSPGWSTMQQMSTGLFATAGDTSAASQATLTLMSSQVMAQAASWGIGDVFFAFSFLIVALAPMALVFKKRERPQGEAPMMAE